MSFITRCPACHTAFKVVGDQLKISEGWVRCGQCQQVFDATLDLQPWWPGTDPMAPPDPAVPVPEPTAAVEDEPAAVDLEPVLGFGAGGASEDPEPVVAPAGPAPLIEEAPWPTAPEVDWPPLRAEAPPPDLSFVRQAQRRARWRRPAVRAALAVLALLLLAVLALQAALHWRDLLAAHVPQAQPALQALCEPLACEVSPPRQLDHLVIDSSVLLRRAPGQYSFSVLVRNQARVALASPALELTLTDVQDQVVVRRVLLPTEWPEPRATLAPGAEWPVQFELELASPQAQTMTGYRAILFYP